MLANSRSKPPTVNKEQELATGVLECLLRCREECALDLGKGEGSDWGQIGRSTRAPRHVLPGLHVHLFLQLCPCRPVSCSPRPDGASPAPRRHRLFLGSIPRSPGRVGGSGARPSHSGIAALTELSAFVSLVWPSCHLRGLDIGTHFPWCPLQGATSLSYSEPGRWHLMGITCGARGLTVAKVRRCLTPQQDLGCWTHGPPATALPTGHAALSSSGRTRHSGRGAGRPSSRQLWHLQGASWSVPPPGC